MKPTLLATTGLALLACGPLATAAEVQVMTQNQYVGMDLIGLVNSSDFNAAVVAALKDRAASLPGERAKALAALIDRRQPALVALEEAYRFTCVDDTPGDARGCENQAIAGAFTDQLADTLAALDGRYVTAAQVVDLDLPASLGLPVPGIPIAYDGTTIFVGVQDRDVILARSDVSYRVADFQSLRLFDPRLCPLPSVDGCNYQAAASADLTIPVPFPPGSVTLPVRFERGFVGVDAVVDGHPYRFVATHLETRLEDFGPFPPFAQVFQYRQAQELRASIQALQSISPSEQVLVAGDFNSDPRDPVLPVPAPLQPILGTDRIVPPYQQFVSTGFTDGWTLRPGTATGQGGPVAGYSCCQDADLANRQSAYYERIDLIFSLVTPTRVPDARLLGDRPADKTWPPGLGLWPSDHASVAATLQFGR